MAQKELKATFMFPKTTWSSCSTIRLRTDVATASRSCPYRFESCNGTDESFSISALDRTTDSTGEIKERVWYGPAGMEHVRTIKEPKQSIPTFAETIDLLMKPENRHVKFNVDVKVQNDPDRLFALMHTIISGSHPDWETLLAPRILLGLWHPCFLEHAKRRLPYCKRSYIGNSVALAKKYFWDDCDTFSMSFAALTGTEGQKFRQECKASGKSIMVWTVNEPSHMMEAVRWEVNVIITDVTQTWLELRNALQHDYDKIVSQYSRIFLWTTINFYSPWLAADSRHERSKLEKVKGPFDRALSTRAGLVAAVA
ncbi:hypothetical protein CC2G_010182 [Coprinopsis cinerea AmutBmut pab1-1]|nr:hypothetical protein CC2G_010182 [Coprinopsis cinerea AmutBmut pab1-1]